MENFVELAGHRQLGLIVPTLQNWEPGDLEQLRRLPRQASTLVLERLVGVGSICRRQATDEIADIVRSLSSLGLSLHGFGVKARAGEVAHGVGRLARMVLPCPLCCPPRRGSAR